MDVADFVFSINQCGQFKNKPCKLPKQVKEPAHIEASIDILCEVDGKGMLTRRKHGLLNDKCEVEKAHR